MTENQNYFLEIKSKRVIKNPNEKIKFSFAIFLESFQPLKDGF